MQRGLHRHECAPFSLPLQHLLLLQWKLQGRALQPRNLDLKWCCRRNCLGPESYPSLPSPGGQESWLAVMTTSQVRPPGYTVTVSLLSNISLVILAGWYNCLFLQSNAREILRRPAAQSFSNTPPFKDVSIILLLNYERLSAWSEKLCQSTPTCDILHLTNFTSW